MKYFQVQLFLGGKTKIIPGTWYQLTNNNNKFPHLDGVAVGAQRLPVLAFAHVRKPVLDEREGEADGHFQGALASGRLSDKGAVLGLHAGEAGQGSLQL